jgi:hypothetical protein
MSQWTHLAGIIRLDNMGHCMVRAATIRKKEIMEEAIAKALGKTCDYNSPDEAWDQCTVPCGSEGSLQYRVFPNVDPQEDSHALSWGYIAIWGDLRDFGSEDMPKIKEWFQKSLEKLMKPEGFGPSEEMNVFEKAEYMLSLFSIRDAILNVHIEYSPITVLLWDEERKKVGQLTFQ